MSITVIGIARYGELGHVFPLDIQQSNLGFTKSDSDFMWLPLQVHCIISHHFILDK